MNLIFYVMLPNGTKTYRDFPFQSPTDMTYKVLAGKTKEEQCQILWHEMASYNWDNWVDLYEQCKIDIMNPYYELSMI